MTTVLPVCLIKGCDGAIVARGWCNAHYTRWRVHGNPLTNLRDVTDEQRFLRFVDPSGGCWEWRGARMSDGYASFQANGKTTLGHRWSYQNWIGPIPDGLTLDHLCRNRGCVNPAHLEPVSSRENVLRSPTAPPAVNARKTHCIHGHEFTFENTYMHKGRRGCRVCRSDADRRHREQRKAS